MNLLGNNSGKLNDIVFENRNKAYGAYAIRQSYNHSLTKSLLLLSALVLLIFGSAYAYNKINAVAPEEKIVMLDDLSKVYEYETKVDLSPVHEQPPQAPSLTAPKGGMSTRIVDEEPVSTPSTSIDNPVNGVGSPTATGTSSTGTETGTTSITSTSTSTSTTAVIPEVIFADEMPEFEGGNAGLMKYVGSNIVYPELAKEAGVQGTVYVSFVVNEMGKVEGAKVLKGIGLGCDEEVLRVINKMPAWKKPGKNAGHAVKVRFNIPVAFRIH